MKHIIKLGLIVTALMGTSLKLSAQSPDSLQHYLRELVLHSPKLQAGLQKYEAARARLPQAGAYPDPTLEVGFLLQPMDIVGGQRVADFKLMQMFPWFGSKGAARREASQMAQMAFEELRDQKDAVCQEFYSSWYGLLSEISRLQTNERHLALLNQLEQLSLTRFASPLGAGSRGASMPMASSSGKGGASSSMNASSMSGMGGMNMGGGTNSSTQRNSNQGGNPSMGGMSMTSSAKSGMAEVLGLQLEKAELETAIERSKSLIRSGKVRLNALMNRPSDSPLTLPEGIERLPYLANVQTLKADILSDNPMLSMLSAQEEAYKAQADMQRKMSYPMIGVGVQYMLNRKTSSPMLAMGDMNGKDMIMPMVSISLPLYRSKYRAQQRESKALQASAIEQRTEMERSLEAQLYQQVQDLEQTGREIELLGKQIALTETTRSLLLKDFSAGRSSLSELLGVYRLLLDYQLRYSLTLASFNTQVASIEQMKSYRALDKFLKTNHHAEQ